MSPENSKKVAYSSQYTDDAKYDYEIEFEDGFKFKHASSAHIVCWENVEIARRMTREAAALKNRQYILHRFGIALHILADTWSHQNFSAMKSESSELDICKKLFDEIDFFLSGKRHPEYRTENILRWSNIRKVLFDLFNNPGNLNNRCSKLKDHINNSALGFTCQPIERDLSYDVMQWFNDAVEVHINDGKATYKKRDNFHNSDWKYFHDAASSHRSFVINELLVPKATEFQ